MRLREINSKIIALNSGLSATYITQSSLGALYPIAPTVTAYSTKEVDGSYTIFFRIMVLIDSDYTKSPVFSIDETTNADFYVVFDLPSKVPTHYTAWYLEASYIVQELADVTVYLQNNDPRTSRGTVTTVIVVVPDATNC